MSIDNENLKDYANGGSYDPKLLEQTIQEVTLLVLKRHFQQCLFDEEIQSIGKFKAICLLNADHANSKENLVNFLYTGIRNEIGNTLKKEKRGTGIVVEYDEALSYGVPGNCSGIEEMQVSNKINENLKVIIENMEDLGFNLRIREVNLYELEELELSELEVFAIRAAVARALLH